MASYKLKQFNQPAKVIEDTLTSNLYMTQITTGTVERRSSKTDLGVTGSNELTFQDECVKLNSFFDKTKNYYFHAKIRRMIEDDQTFYIYLVKFKNNEVEDIKTQYLKTIVVQKGSPEEWVDFETVFNPLIDNTFDCILFQLQRTVNDYQGEIRYPTIIYEELSQINEIESLKDIKMLKMGVQSHPGLIMCINGEEVHIGKSGIYEIRNGVILVEFFSIVKGGVEKSLTENGETITFSEFLNRLSNQENENKEEITSKCLFGNSKTRNIDAFTLDYMYKEEEQG